MTSLVAIGPQRRPGAEQKSRRSVGVHAFSWGDNPSGALLTGTVARSPVPAPVGLPDGTSAVALGADFSVALTSGGTVWAWGANDFGQLGDGTTTSRLSPVRVRVPGRVRAVSAGRHHVVALTTNGRVLGWGRNHLGQLGDGTTTDRSVPTFASTPQRFSALSGGDVHTLGIAGGRAWAWGGGSAIAGQAGPVLAPARVPLPADLRVRSVSAGAWVSAVLTREGRALAWGRGAGSAAQPLTVSEDAIAVSAGRSQVLAVMSDGGVAAWGTNSQGELGDGSTTLRRDPVTWRLPNGERIHRLDVADGHAVVLTRSGKLYCWGANRVGQAGVGPGPDQLSPTEITSLAGVRVAGFAVGHHHVFVLARQGPPVRLRVSLQNPTVRVNRPTEIRVREVDVFDTDLGPVNSAAVTVNGQPVHGDRFVVTAPGTYLVVARKGQLRGSLRVVTA